MNAATPDWWTTPCQPPIIMPASGGQKGSRVNVQERTSLVTPGKVNFVVGGKSSCKLTIIKVLYNLGRPIIR